MKNYIKVFTEAGKIINTLGKEQRIRVLLALVALEGDNFIETCRESLIGNKEACLSHRFTEFGNRHCKDCGLYKKLFN